MDNQISLSNDEKLTLERAGVRLLVLFGSQAQGIANKTSDFDFGYLAKNDPYDLLYDLLSSKINRLINIDIVNLETAPAELQMHVAKFGKVVFESTPQTFANFKEKTMISYADFEPLRKIFQQATLDRINLWRN